MLYVNYLDAIITIQLNHQIINEIWNSYFTLNSIITTNYSIVILIIYNAINWLNINVLYYIQIELLG